MSSSFTPFIITLPSSLVFLSLRLHRDDELSEVWLSALVLWNNGQAQSREWRCLNAMITFEFDPRDTNGRGCETAIRFGREGAS